MLKVEFTLFQEEEGYTIYTSPPLHTTFFFGWKSNPEKRLFFTLKFHFTFFPPMP